MGVKASEMEVRYVA